MILSFYVRKWVSKNQVFLHILSSVCHNEEEKDRKIFETIPKDALSLKQNSHPFSESIKKKQFLHRELSAFLLILTETAQCPLIQLFFPDSCFFWVEIYKIKIFKHLPFAKISSRKIFKNLRK